MKYWFMGAAYGETDMSDKFISEGKWVRGMNVPQYADAVNSASAGDLIAIKSVYTKSRPEALPFDNNGKVISVMAIKAIGVITENKTDGRNLLVKWSSVALEESREWYFYTYKPTVWLPKLKNWQTQCLVNFAFHNKKQDIPRFMEFYSNRKKS